MAVHTVIYLDVPLATSTGRPIGCKKAKAKAVVVEATSSEQVRSSIDKWKTKIPVIRAQETRERWASKLEKQDKKIELETVRVVVKS
jgi:hypothetical protein